MDSFLQKQVTGPSDQVKKLVFDGCKPVSLTKLTPFSNLRSLSLNVCAIQSLEGFPKLDNLDKLSLSDNRLAGGLESLGQLSSLRVLDLSNNRLGSLEELKPLKPLISLTSLDLFSNPLTKSKDYRKAVFEMFSNLQALDGEGRDGKEIDLNEDSDDEDSQDDEEEEEEEDDDVDGQEGLDKEENVGNEKAPPAKRQKLESKMNGAGNVDDGDEESDGEEDDEEEESEDDVEEEEDPSLTTAALLGGDFADDEDDEEFAPDDKDEEDDDSEADGSDHSGDEK